MPLFNKKILSVFIILFMFFNINTAFAANEKQQMKTVEQKRTALRQKINSLAQLEKRQTSIITKNQQKLEKNNQDLKNSQRQFEAKDANSKRLEKELNEYLKEYNERNKLLLKRIRCIYKAKRTLILYLLNPTNSISQFLDRIYYQNVIIQSDKQTMYVLRGEARKIAVMRRRVENEKRQISRLIQNINREKSSIQNTLNQNKTMLEKIQKDKKAYEKSEKELAKQSSYLAWLISKSTKNSQVTGVKGIFILPYPPKTVVRISSPFGWRTHPIFKSKIFHTGIDYAMAFGTPILASNSGKVIYSGWYGGYGKVVIIDHGSCTGAPTTTLYAHMSRQNVAAGQFVNRGDIIGFVGSTGYSTGPHVHFEVRINGKPQNPKNYL